MDKYILLTDLKKLFKFFFVGLKGFNLLGFSERE